MKLHYKNDNYLWSMDRVLSYFVLVLMYMSCVFDTIYERATDTNLLYLRLFRYSQYLIVVFGISMIALDLLIYSKRKRVVVIMFIMFLYEVGITKLMGILDIRSIVADNLTWIVTFCFFFIHGKKKQKEDRVFQRIIIFGTLAYTIFMLPNLKSHIMGLDYTGGIISLLYYGLGFLWIILFWCLAKI